MKDTRKPQLERSPSKSLMVLSAGLVYLAIGIVCYANCQNCPPVKAYKYRHELRRQVIHFWGVDQDRSIFAAQLHAESSWNPEAKSPYAEGLGQQTPDTAAYLESRDAELAGIRNRRNPRYSIRALVFYDRILWDRIGAAWRSVLDREAAMLHSYNSGPGWLIKERQASQDPGRYFGSIDQVCRRRPQACEETARYVTRILTKLRPLYEGF